MGLFKQKDFEAQMEDIQKRFEKAVQGLDKDTRDDLQESTQDIMKGIREVAEKAAERNERADELATKSQQVKSLLEEREKLQKQVNRLEQQVSGTYKVNVLDVIKNTGHDIKEAAQEAWKSCTKRIGEFKDEITKMGQEFKEHHENQKAERAEQRRLKDEYIAAKNTIIQKNSQIEFYKEQKAINEKAIEKLEARKIEMQKSNERHQQADRKIGLIKNGFKNLINAFKGEDGKSMEENGIQVSLFSKLNQVPMQIQEEIGQMELENTGYDKMIELLEQEKAPYQDIVHDYEMDQAMDKENLVPGNNEELSFEEYLEQAQLETDQINENLDKDELTQEQEQAIDDMER